MELFPYLQDEPEQLTDEQVAGNRSFLFLCFIGLSFCVAAAVILHVKVSWDETVRVGRGHSGNTTYLFYEYTILSAIFIYSWLSLSRLSLCGITAYLEVKTWSVF